MPFPPLPIAAEYRRLAGTAKTDIRDGNVSVFLTLALCLVVPFGGVGIVAAMSLMSIAASRGKLLAEALKLYAGPWLKSDAFALNLLILLVTLVEAGLVFYHGDDPGDLENQIKQYVMALAILLTIRRFPAGAVLWGAAAGCFLGGLMALSDLFLIGLDRADGPTNAIRFGMLAALLSVFCLIGAVFGRPAKLTRIVMAVATCAGIVAVFASGSRGAVLAVPAMLLLLVPRLWRNSRMTAMLAGLVFLLFSVALGIWQVSLIRSDLSNLMQAADAMVTGGDVEERSAHNRMEMLKLAAELFAAHPVAGVGAHGWDEAVAAQMRNSPPETALDEAFNQPHNQFANDFAKGGLLRGVGGLAMIFFPLFLFLRRRPFRSGPESIAPLLGATTCVAYFVFCLTESVMDLSLTASIYAVLIFYLIASSEGAPLSTPDAERRAAHAAG